MTDRFGDVMLFNLKGRGCPLAGVEACSSLRSQEERFTQIGWHGARALEMSHVYRNILPRNEIHRIETLEFLDEKELLEQLLQHYCICTAWKDGHDLNLQNIGID